MRIASGRVAVEDCVALTARVGGDGIGVNLHHVRDRDLAAITALGDRIRDLGLVVGASGDFVGAARNGARVVDGVERVRGWVERAAAIGSSYVRVASSFYRAELAGRPELIDLERGYVTEVLAATADEARAAGVTVLLENHSDFTIAEYRRIVADVGPDRIGVFLDVINPIAAFDDPLPTIAELAPLARAGHVKDYVLESIQQPDHYHRRGFSVLYRYPGEGQADLGALLGALVMSLPAGEPYLLTLEGLDNRAEVDDQEPRIIAALARVRGLVGA